MTEKPPLIIINSPTATGKTKLALELALAFGGEIVNADSLQVYRYLDIGTAKPTVAERSKVKHHLIDVVDPDEEFNAAIFTERAKKVIEDLNKSGKPVFLVGGTGLYVRALTRGIIETPKVDENIRNYYRRIRDEKGKEYLYGLLREKDKEAAGRINPNDAVRVIRALEVLEQTGESIVAIQRKHAFRRSGYNTCKIGLKMERSELKKRIGLRTDQMIAAGLLDEVKSVLERGYKEDLKPLQSLGYRQVIDFLGGKRNWDDTVQLMKKETWFYAKRQMTWFAADREINWYSADLFTEIFKNVEVFLREFPPGAPCNIA